MARPAYGGRPKKPERKKVMLRPPPPPLGNQSALGNEGGRPTDYRPEYCEQARKLCQFGATLAEVAHFFDVTVPTICSWQNTYPEFFNSMKLGRQASDDRVERSFYQRAIGYDVKTTRTVSKTGDGSVTETIVHLPGDVTAQMKWLSIRRPKQWRGDMPDGTQPQERSTAEIKELVIAKLLEWGLKVVPIDAAPSPIMLEGDTPKPNGGGNGENR